MPIQRDYDFIYIRYAMRIIFTVHEIMLILERDEVLDSFYVLHDR
jgi:hypothetical protein